MRRFFSSCLTLVVAISLLSGTNASVAAQKPDPKNVLVIGMLAKCSEGWDWRYGDYANWKPARPFRKGSTFTYKYSEVGGIGPIKMSVTMGSKSGTVKYLGGDDWYLRPDGWECPRKFTITYKYVWDVIRYG